VARSTEAAYAASSGQGLPSLQAGQQNTRLPQDAEQTEQSADCELSSRTLLGQTCYRDSQVACTPHQTPTAVPRMPPFLPFFPDDHLKSSTLLSGLLSMTRCSGTLGRT
jgi:hypothetical protein